MTNNILDVIIIGAGPAGLTASIYCSCFHLSHIIIGKTLGGQLQFAPHILNYPGFENITGKQLTDRMVKQATKRAKEVDAEVNGEIINDEVTKINKMYRNTPVIPTKAGIYTDGSPIKPGMTNVKPGMTNYNIQTKTEGEYFSRSIILATGMERRKLNIPGEVEYTGKGVLYCATCEKQDYKNKVCGVIGGANSAVQAAVQVAQAASKVYLIYRGTELRGDPVWLDEIKRQKKIEVLYQTQAVEILGDNNKVTGVKLSNNGKLKLDKLFIEIGGVPGTALMIPIGVKMDKGGYVHVNQTLETNVPGVFAAGDLIHYGFSIEQIASAVGLGARAAATAFSYIKGEEKVPSVWGKSQIKR